MKTFFKLLSFIKPYKKEFFLGLILSFLAASFNGISITGVIPIFDVLTYGKERPFQIPFNQEEIELLLKNPQTKKELKKLLQQGENLHPEVLKWIKEIPPQKEKSLSFGEKIFFLVGYGKLKANLYLLHISPLTVIIGTCIIISIIYLFRLLFFVGMTYFLSSAGYKAVQDIRNLLFEKVSRLPISYFHQERTGNITSRIINDATLVAEGIAEELKSIIHNLFMIITHFALLAIINWKLMLIVSIGLPLIFWPASSVARKLRDLVKSGQEYLGELHAILQEFIGGIRVIKAFDMYPYERKKFIKANKKLTRRYILHRFFHTLSPSFTDSVIAFIAAGLLIYGSIEILEGNFTPGMFLSFLITLMISFAPIKRLNIGYNLLQNALGAGERIFAFLELPEEKEEVKNPVFLPKLQKEIFFSHVYFRYDKKGPWVLKNIHIRIPVGSTVALVGKSGAGKSTLVDLIPRFYEVEKGAIYFDGIDIRRIPLKALREKIGIVTQEIFLFYGTIYENITCGKNVPLEEVERVAKLAYADEFIKKLPKGYFTLIGERGVKLSGGQRQRIQIARALIKDAPILILDEATSNLDTESEKKVQLALENLMADKTSIVIAHRLSTIYKADSILVIDKGRIVQRGRHEELLQQGGLYKKLYEMQFDL